MDLSVIILSYNTKDITAECLRRLRGAVDRVGKKGSKVQVIVLDNASKDGSVEMIKKSHSWVELIESKENTGYSKGNNIAFKKAQNPIILLLNSDVYVEEDTLEKASERFKNPDCDVLGVKLVFENEAFQPSAGNLPDPLNTIFWILGLSYFGTFHPKNESYFEKDREVGWVTGAFFMIRKEIFEKVGGFDESIFMYMDEVDLCKRLNMAGFKVYFTPGIVLTHLHRASNRDNPEQVFVKELEGIKIYFKKYYPGSYFIVKLFLILGLLFRIIGFSLLGKIKRAGAYMEGLSVV